MLEAGEVLKTYRLDSPPGQLLGQPCTATRIQDHPIRFLSYEGNVNRGRGNVRIVDSGTYQLFENGAESFRLDLEGETLRGQFRLAHIKGNEWEFGQCNNPDAR